ncbi:MAG: ROK family protein [Chloroflexales bacterium]|nr:ROK family protein [Chloroflexales bacterium]
MADPQMLVQERLAHNSWGLLGTQGYVLGVDLGGYGLRAALVDLSKHTYTSIHAEIQNDAPESVVAAALNLARKLLADNDVAPDRLVRVGVGFGGPVDPRFGTIRFSPRQSGWEGFPLQERFESTFDAVTLIDNDANLIALAEATFGVGKGTGDLFYLHLSSGVGGGIVLEGRLYHGATATAGEVGHVVVGQGWDGVGQPATLEELASISGLLRRAGELGLSTDNLNDIFSDNPIGQRVVQETTTLLALRLAQIIALLDPQMIVLGGIVVRIGGNAFIQAIERQTSQFIAPRLARPIPIVASVLGFDSVVMGAVALALESLCE